MEPLMSKEAALMVEDNLLKSVVRQMSSDQMTKYQWESWMPKEATYETWKAWLNWSYADKSFQ